MSDDTTDRSTPMVDMTRSFLNTVADGRGDELVDELAQRTDLDSVEQTLAGGLAAGETIAQMRERSRAAADQVAGGEGDSDGGIIAETRMIESESGEYAGTRVWVDDPAVDVFHNDSELLLRRGHEELAVSVPQGVGTVDDHERDGVRRLTVRPPGWEPTVASSDDDADDSQETIDESADQDDSEAADDDSSGDEGDD